MHARSLPMRRASVTVANKELARLAVHPHRDVLAAVGRRSAVILRLYGSTMEIAQHHLDEDRAECYTCAVLFDCGGAVHLAVGGAQGVVKVASVTAHRFGGFLRGHGGAVTDLCAHTQREAVLFSASEDTTVRMWDSRAWRCLAIFGGCAGHRDFVLSVDVSACGRMLVSAGTDCAVKVWDIPEPGNGTQCVYFPRYSSSKIHKSYVSCVRFYGRLVLSKSLRSRIVAVHPDLSAGTCSPSQSSDSVFIDEHTLPSDARFTDRFSVGAGVLAVGILGGSSPDRVNRTVLFELSRLGAGLAPFTATSGLAEIRDVAIGGDSLFILYEDSRIERLLLSRVRKAAWRAAAAEGVQPPAEHVRAGI